MRRLYPIALVTSMVLGLFACSNNAPQTDAGADAGDAGIDVIIDPQNCVPPGTKPNDQGMGGYCSPGGGQCDTAGPSGAPRICTADVSGTPEHAWFCTYPCTTSATCGAGVSCISNSQGSGCVPDICDYLADGGLDSGTDAAGDAASDASTDATGD